jgi:hypothetical protein
MRSSAETIRNLKRVMPDGPADAPSRYRNGAIQVRPATGSLTRNRGRSLPSEWQADVASEA